MSRVIEPKGKDIFMVKNHVRLIFASNNQWVVPAGLSDRRFMVLDVSNARARDRAWFDPLWKQMDNGGREAMLHDLLHVDLSGIDLRDFPRTEARLDQIMHSMSTVEKWWLDILQEGRIGERSDWVRRMGTSWFYTDYSDFARKAGNRYPLTKAQFGKALRDLCPEMERKREKGGSREWQYHFPPLEDCRRAFEEKVGQPIGWD
jgi:phage/plasmid-associated DNA primase